MNIIFISCTTKIQLTMKNLKKLSRKEQSKINGGDRNAKILCSWSSQNTPPWNSSQECPSGWVVCVSLNCCYDPNPLLLNGCPD
ncbi:hypothetical protein BCF50_2365 [Chryseobacterium daecheongense]|uniref:Bacteriocin n=2 Tax=Chryseobacterium daecheongense TaxID=192389 RepID=A0ABY2FWK9_9FLAO|nr:hypothetical protein BCF50_2365 [Chryseobacterium daecheongense]